MATLLLDAGVDIKKAQVGHRIVEARRDAIALRVNHICIHADQLKADAHFERACR